MPNSLGLARGLAGLTVSVLLAGACADGDGKDRSASSAAPTTSTTEAAPPTTAATTAPPPPPPTSTAPPPTRLPAATPPPNAAGTCPSIPARAMPRPDRPRYRLKVDVKPAENVVEGEVAVRFIPDLPTDRVVFRLWANSPRTARAGARLDAGGVTVGGRAVDAVMESPTMLVVRPGGTLAAGQPLDIVVPWRLTLPGPAEDRISRSGDSIRLGSFFPILAWEPGVGWAVEPATSGFAEASSAITADFDATVTVPPGLDVLATGTSSGVGQWTATAVPDFAISIGRFSIATATVNAPQPVQVTVGVHAGVAESPGAYLSRVTRSLEDLSRRYGPYPWPSYSLVISPALSGGIEYPMHVFQGPGTISRTTPHEVAHMWFYGLVGSNQGRDPWLDEGIASFAEARVENTLASFRSRSIPTAGRRRLGEPMTFWESRQSVYYRSVYVQGAQALAALGDADLVDCALRVYVARNAYRVARPGDLVDAARAVFPNAGEVLAGYGVRP